MNIQALRPTPFYCAAPVGFALAVALLAAGCAPAAPSPTQPPAAPKPAPPTAAPQPKAAAPEKAPAKPPGPPVTLKVASGVGLFRSGLDIGIARDHYKQQNLEIDLVSLETGPDQLPFMASGQLDIVLTGPSSAHFNALAADIPVKFVASCGNSSPTGREGNVLLVARKDLYDSGQLKELKDLAGKRIGIPNLQSKGYVDAWAFTEKAGLKLTDVTLVAPMAFPEMIVGLANKAIDAAITLEPFVTQGISQGAAVVIGGDEQIMSRRQGCAVAMGERLVKDRELGKRFLRGYLGAVRDYNDAFFKNQGKPDIVKIMVEKYPVKDPALYDRMYPFSIDPNGFVNTESIELDVRFYKAQGLLTAEPNVKTLVDPTLAEEVVKELGVYQ